MTTITAQQFTRLVSVDQISLRDDGRTVEGRVVPFNEIAEVVEPNPETGVIEAYQEQFLPGSLARVIQGVRARGNAGFIPFLLDHAEGFDNRVGYGVDLQEATDGVHGIFKLYDSDHLRKVQSMLRESHTGLSVSFGDIRKPQLIDGIVSRVQVMIGHVAATPWPAYAGATISAVRSASGAPVVPPTPRLDGLRDWLAQNATAAPEGASQ